MVDTQRIEKCALYWEMDEGQRTYWYDMKTKKFLHNIDTFYYSVKLAEDFTHESQDKNVLAFRRVVENIKNRLALQGYGGDTLQLLVHGGKDDYLNILPLSFGRYYSFCLESPEEFDIFIAPVVPGSAETVSVTSEIIVQIRASMLWELGVTRAFEKSYGWVQALCSMYGFTIQEVKENRTDFCWHTNYLEQPEKFFSLDSLSRMQVSRYAEGVMHFARKRSGESEIDYISFGRRGGRCFIRIYNKCKEVVEKNYKPFFLRTWLFHGLINRYDLYVLEEAYKQKSWRYTTVARLRFYMEHGADPLGLALCKEQIDVYETGGKVTDRMMDVADELTPPLNLIYNIEFQLMRKASKSYELPIYWQNEDKGPAKRIYDFFDNRRFICDYLTTDIFRLVEKTGDENMSRRPDCGFWIALKRTKMVDVAPVPKFMEENPEKYKIHRIYDRKLNAEKMKITIMRKAMVYGMYLKGKNEDSPVNDVMLSVLRLNDNDIHDAKMYKARKAKTLSKAMLETVLPQEETKTQYNFTIIDGNTGEFYGLPSELAEEGA